MDNSKNPVELALIGLSIMDMVIGESSVDSDTEFFADQFTPLELFSFTSAALAMMINIESMDKNTSVEDYIAQLRERFNGLSKD